MIDNSLIGILANQLDAAIANAGWDYLTSQKVQPEQEGTPTQGTVFFERIGDHRYGHPIFKEVYQPGPDNFAEVSNQLVETTFQISTLIPQNPEDLTLPTATDVAEYVCQYLQSRATMRYFRQYFVSTLRVTDVRTPFIILDRDRFEGHPNFDITLQHNRLLTLTVPAASSIVGAPSGVPGIPGEGVFVVPDGPGQSYP